MEKWNADIIEHLKQLYIETDVPSDQLIADNALLTRFTNQFNEKIEAPGNFTNEEVAQKLLRIRKSGQLPTIR